MNTYTFSLHYKGGNYNSQYGGDSVEEAILNWATCEPPHIQTMKKKEADLIKAEAARTVEVKKRHLNRMQNDIYEDREQPTTVGTLKNVWYMNFLYGHTHMHLIIVKTAVDE